MAGVNKGMIDALREASKHESEEQHLPHVDIADSVIEPVMETSANASVAEVTPHPTRKRTRIRRESVSKPRVESKITREKEDEESIEGHLSLRLSTELLEETRNAAWYAGIEISEYARRALREKNKKLSELLGGTIPERPSRPAPLKGLFED